MESLPRVFFIKCIIVLLSVITLPVYSSYAQNEAGSIILSGQIKNVPPQPDGKTIVELSYPYESKLPVKKILLAADGSFRDTVQNIRGKYILWDEKNRVHLYLDNSKKYSIQYDAAHFKDGNVVLAGANVAINKYYIKKSQQRIMFDPSGEGKTENAFRQFLGGIKTKSLDRIKNANLPAEIAHFEIRSVAYEYLYYLYLFLALRELEDSTFKISPVSAKELAINYSNEEDYKKYPHYKNLVYEYYQKQFRNKEKESRKTDSLFSLAQHRIKLAAAAVPNEYIKNQLIAEMAMFDLKEAKDIAAFYSDLGKYYTGNDEAFKENIASAYLRLTKLKKGEPSPQFADYRNYKGGTNSLSDFGGKYVYIDLWATWCGNCPGEIPYMKELERIYEGKNIVFVSISIDEDVKAWEKMVKKEMMNGIQLLATDKGGSFTKEYAVHGVPRYIFLDPNGAIIEYSAPRPSEKEELAALFKSVGL